jgi:hypothetical protein
MFIERRAGGVEAEVEEVEIQEAVNAARCCPLVLCGGNHANEKYQHQYIILTPVLSIVC